MAIAARGSIPAVRTVDARAELAPAFETFWEAMNFLYRDFYGQLPASDEATYGAIRGVIDQLDDPNTSFMTPQEAEFFRTSIRGHFEGIGAHVEWDDEHDAVMVTEPFENQPAWNAGIRRGDLILAVDGESIVGTNLNDAVAMIRGPKDSTVVLTILRDGEGEPFDVEVVRDRIEPPTISTTTMGEEGEIAYVRLNTFNENAGQLVRQAVQDAVDRGATALVFDLRGNTGGLLREAVKVASVFLDSDETVLIERFSDGREEIYHTEGKPVAPDLSLVVLVDGGSASASEIVAGALQDAGRSDLVGTTTYGKGSVQLPHTLTDGSIMRVTIARWYTPNDRSIDGAGLEPDVMVEINDEELKAGEDPQLDRALELLQAEVGVTR
jgi:carboxyl-terminal processing protease